MRSSARRELIATAYDSPSNHRLLSRIGNGRWPDPIACNSGPRGRNRPDPGGNALRLVAAIGSGAPRHRRPAPGAAKPASKAVRRRRRGDWLGWSRHRRSELEQPAPAGTSKRFASVKPIFVVANTVICPSPNQRYREPSHIGKSHIGQYRACWHSLIPGPVARPWRSALAQPPDPVTIAHRERECQSDAAPSAGPTGLIPDVLALPQALSWLGNTR